MRNARTPQHFHNTLDESLMPLKLHHRKQLCIGNKDTQAGPEAEKHTCCLRERRGERSACRARFTVRTRQKYSWLPTHLLIIIVHSCVSPSDTRTCLTPLCAPRRRSLRATRDVCVQWIDNVALEELTFQPLCRQRDSLSIHPSLLPRTEAAEPLAGMDPAVSHRGQLAIYNSQLA